MNNKVKIYARLRRPRQQESNDSKSIEETTSSPLTAASLIPPLTNLEQFEDRLRTFLDELKNLFFGITYKTTIKRDTSNQSLVAALLEYEKCEKNLSLLPEKLETYSFLKLALEKDAPLLLQDEYLLGIQRDRSGISDPQKNAIVAQCAARVLWFLEKNKIPTIMAMAKRLKNKKDPLCCLLELENFEIHTIKNWIKQVFPVPKKERQGRDSEAGKPISNFADVVPIPGIFLEDGRVNFPKLRFAIMCTTRILKSLGYDLNSAVESRFITFYVQSLQFYPSRYVNDWAQEAFLGNSSIFDP